MSLRLARKIAGMTQHQLATAAGLEHTFISRLENGERSLRGSDYATVLALAAAINLSPDELITIVEAPPVVIGPRQRRRRRRVARPTDGTAPTIATR